ncbi:MAG: polyprenol monophosphomannose synthase [Anaerolineales bacterium]
MLPTYNEAENLRPMTEALRGLSLEADLNILVVDDNSPDGTGDLADALAAQYPQQIQVLHRQAKEGLGKAYLAGFQKALQDGADLILQMDCDFSHKPEYIPDMLAAIQDADMVLASRFAKGGKVDDSWAWWRKLLSWFANSVYVRLMLNTHLRDSTGGFRLWRRETLLGMDIQERIHSNGYVFQVEMAYVALKLGYIIKEIPIYFPDRQAGESKMSFHVQYEAALRVLEVYARHRQLRPDDRAALASETS